MFGINKQICSAASRYTLILHEFDFYQIKLKSHNVQTKCVRNVAYLLIQIYNSFDCGHSAFPMEVEINFFFSRETCGAQNLRFNILELVCTKSSVIFTPENCTLLECGSSFAISFKFIRSILPNQSTSLSNML